MRAPAKLVQERLNQDTEGDDCDDAEGHDQQCCS